MQEDIFIKGIWFLPNKSQTRITGELSFSRSQGAELKLLGILSYNSKSRADIDKNVSIINGISSDGVRITLYKCYMTQRGFHSEGLETSTYDCIYVFLGVLLQRAEDLVFNELRCRIKNFELWLDSSGFKKMHFNKESCTGIIEYQQPDDHLYKVSSMLDIIFRFGTAFPRENNSYSVNIDQKCEIIIKPTNLEATFEALLDWLFSFNHFMSLAYFGLPNKMEIYVAKRESLIPDDSPLYMNAYKVLFPSRKGNFMEKERKHRYDFLFQFPTVQDNFEQIIRKWFEAESTIDPVIGALVESFINKDQPVEFKFLNLAHAIETFHRRLRLGTVESTEVFKEKLSSILENTPENYKLWLKEKLNYSNEYTLHERIDLLINELPQRLKTALFKPSVPEFIKNFKNSRNYYTHYDSRLKKKALHGNDLFYLTERMKIFLVALLMREVGFTDEETEEIVLKRSIFLYNHIIDRNEISAYYYPSNV